MVVVKARTSELLSLLDTAHIHFLAGARTKEELLDRLVRRLAEIDELSDPEGMLRDIMMREGESSTGVGHEVAIPHCAPEIDREHLMLARVEPPVPFNSHDGLPVRFVFLILTPWKRQALYLRLLAEIARLTRRGDLLGRMRDAPDPSALLDVLADALRPPAGPGPSGGIR